MELSHRLHALRTHMLTEQEIDLAISEFGSANYLEARINVEQCLRHPSPQIREHALETLTMSWGLSAYQEIAFQFLQDPDPGCRIQGIYSLNPTGKPLDDLRILKAYAAIVAAKEETTTLRSIAYGCLLTACGNDLHYDYWREIDDYLDNEDPFEQAPWIDWKLVHFFTAEDSKSIAFETALTYLGENEQEPRSEWIDQHGRIFCSGQQLVNDVVLRAHRLARLRLPAYRMVLTIKAPF